jgi:hypothetical protein
MKTINKDEIKTARDLEVFFWKFHNEVNEGTKKVLFPEEKLEMYKKESVTKINTEFKDVLYMYYQNIELSNEFNTWMKQNENKFTHINEVKEDAKDKKKDKKDAKYIKDSKDRKD